MCQSPDLDEGHTQHDPDQGQKLLPEGQSFDLDNGHIQEVPDNGQYDSQGGQFSDHENIQLRESEPRDFPEGCNEDESLSEDVFYLVPVPGHDSSDRDGRGLERLDSIYFRRSPMLHDGGDGQEEETSDRDSMLQRSNSALFEGE